MGAHIDRDARISPTIERCVCLHAKQRHEVAGFDGECIAEGCRCAAFELRLPQSADAPTPPPFSAPRLAPVSLTTIEQTLTAARELSDKRTTLVVTRVEHLVAELRNRIYAERNKARDAELEAEIKQLDAGTQRRGVPDKTCTECGQTGLRNLGVHRRNKHGYRRPSVAQPAPAEAAS
jgi:hypothetical protein